MFTEYYWSRVALKEKAGERASSYEKRRSHHGESQAPRNTTKWIKNCWQEIEFMKFHCANDSQFARILSIKFCAASSSAANQEWSIVRTGLSCKRVGYVRISSAAGRAQWISLDFVGFRWIALDSTWWHAAMSFRDENIGRLQQSL